MPVYSAGLTMWGGPGTYIVVGGYRVRKRRRSRRVEV